MEICVLCCFLYRESAIIKHKKKCMGRQSVRSSFMPAFSGRKGGQSEKT